VLGARVQKKELGCMTGNGLGLFALKGDPRKFSSCL
jgi:hypothetical protein